MAQTTVTYVADAGQREFDVTFPYLDAAHVHVTVRDLPVTFTFASPSRLRLGAGVSEGSAVRVYRKTPVDEALVQFQAGATLTEADLNTAIQQTLFIQQELGDLYDGALTDALVRLGDNLGIVTDPSSLIDEMVQMTLGSSVLNEFRERIFDIDLSAETLIEEALRNFASRERATALQARVNLADANLTITQDRVLEAEGRILSLTGVVDGLVNIGDGAGIATLIAAETLERITADTAQVSMLALIGAANGSNTAFDLNLSTVRVTPTETLAQRLTALSAATASARALVIAETTARVDADTAAAGLLTGITARVGTAEATAITDRAARVSGDSALTTSLDALTARMGTSEAQVVTDRAARVSGDSALATSLDAATARIGASEATILTDRAARVSGDSVNATAIDLVRARTATAEATLISDRAARVAGDEASATALDVVRTRTASSEASIISDRASRVSGDTALGTRIDAVTASVGDTVALVGTETTARIAADNAEAALRVALATRLGTAEAAILTETTTRTSAIAAEAALRTTLATRVGATEGAILAETTNRSNADGAILSTLSLLGARNAGGTAFVVDMATAQVGGGVSLGTRFSGLDTRVGLNEAAVIAETTARTTALAAETASRVALGTRVGLAEAAALTEATARSDADAAEAALRVALGTRMGLAEAAILTEASTRSDAISAEAALRTTLASTVGGHTSSITSILSSVDGLSARAGLTLDVNGFVTGWSLNNDGDTGSFSILANHFAIIDPGAPGSAPLIPFEISGGVVRIRNALIDNLDLVRLGSGTFNGDMAVGTGKIIFNNGTTMMVHGVGFGTTNQFLEWSGPSMDISLCSEANGVRWFKTTGDAYFGGSLSIGTLTSKVATSSLAVAPEVETASFGSNGDQISVALSYNRQIVGRSATAPATGAITATITLYRSIGGGAYAGVATLTATGTQTATYDGEFGNYIVTANISGSATYSDPSLSVSNRQFKAVVSARGGVTTLGSATGTQNLSIIATEQ